MPARDNGEDGGDGDMPGRDRNQSVIILTAADVSVVDKQWNSCKCVKVAAAKISLHVVIGALQAQQEACCSP